MLKKNTLGGVVFKKNYKCIVTEKEDQHRSVLSNTKDVVNLIYCIEGNFRSTQIFELFELGEIVRNFKYSKNLNV